MRARSAANRITCSHSVHPRAPWNQGNVDRHGALHVFPLAVLTATAHCMSFRFGHLYQGRFKSFPVQSDDQLLGLLRYVERNPLTAGLVDRAQLWRWGGLWSRTRDTEAIKALLSPWPVERPANWAARVNVPLTTKELDRVRVSIERGRRYGEEKWVRETVKDLGLAQTVRPEGRPRKASQSATEATR
jgi:putative transposase